GLLAGLVAWCPAWSSPAPSRSEPAGSSRGSGPLLDGGGAVIWEAAALQRLNHDRDPAILLTLAEAGVLTTSEVRRLHFGTIQACRRRLRVLRDLRLVGGFRPGRGRDEETWWALADRGAQLLSGIL